MHGRVDIGKGEKKSFVAQYSVAGIQKLVSSSRKGRHTVGAGRKYIYCFHGKRKRMDVLSATDVRYVEVAFQDLSEHPKFYSKEKLEIETFATKSYCRCVRQDEVFEDLFEEVA